MRRQIKKHFSAEIFLREHTLLEHITKQRVLNIYEPIHIVLVLLNSSTKRPIFYSPLLFLMDEVDGMAGNEDRGGIQELISLIKDSSIPIICMCNDRNHQKMRSLVNYCYNLRFSRPRLEQIRGTMLSICFKEKFKLTPTAIDEIISATNNDIRQTINHLTLMSANNSITLSQTKQDTAKKDMKLGPWDVVRKVFSAEEHKTMSFSDKADLFFNDYSMGPLFVQQNYLIVAPKAPK
ncbi:hypothetical protein HA402_004265 [Bradysia odoriphaga]|nr:hypothetical protein HA402_004265 [Bradysia odoriphaga]